MTPTEYLEEAETVEAIKLRIASINGKISQLTESLAEIGITKDNAAFEIKLLTDQIADLDTKIAKHIAAIKSEHGDAGED